MPFQILKYQAYKEFVDLSKNGQQILTLYSNKYFLNVCGLQGTT